MRSQSFTRAKGIDSTSKHSVKHLFTASLPVNESPLYDRGDPVLATPPYESHSLITVELDDVEELLDDCSDIDDSPPPKPKDPPSLQSLSGALPIQLLLDTQSDIPEASTFRLTSPPSLLSLVGGGRVLSLHSNQSFWDRMPYSASAAIVHAHTPTEEDTIEAYVGSSKMNGLKQASKGR